MMRTLIYDDQCRLCVTAKEGLERVGEGTEVRFVPYQSEEAARRLGADYKPGRPDAAFLVEGNGAISRGLDAFLPLVPGLRGGRVLHAILKATLVRPLAALAYRFVARHRYKLFGSVG
jgi:predicted DCC family thiol-disulfide oxidoreductase YuxK